MFRLCCCAHGLFIPQAWQHNPRSASPPPSQLAALKRPVVSAPAGLLNINNHDRWHGGVEGSDLGEAGGQQSSAGCPAVHREPQAGQLPSRCRISQGEQAGCGLSRIEFHKHATQILSVSVSATITTTIVTGVQGHRGEDRTTDDLTSGKKHLYLLFLFKTTLYTLTGR